MQCIQDRLVCATLSGAVWKAVGLIVVLWCAAPVRVAADAPRAWVEIRAVYGGFPAELTAEGKRLSDSGINAVFVGSGGITAELAERVRREGVQLFAEFNTLHAAGYLKQYPDAAPVGVDGKPCPAPHGWQGVCPTHAGYRRFRMGEFEKTLNQPIEGIWLDYHHSHASWERADPEMPDTCFCQGCLRRFAEQTGLSLPEKPPAELAAWLLGPQRDRWVRWRCDVFTDWIREFRAIRDRVRPKALLGTFHCPWSDTERQGALREKLAIDLRAQSEYLDVLSPMPYHARFGHPADPAWINRQVSWLGRHLGLKGAPEERVRIWPIVQLADWGEKVPSDEVAEVLRHGSERPARGVIVFHWGGLRRQPDKVAQMAAYLRSIAPQRPPAPR